MKSILSLILVAVLCSRVVSQAAGETPMIKVRAAGIEAEIAFESAEQLGGIIKKLSEHGGGELEFAPGSYEFEKSVELPEIRGVHLRGHPGTIFRLRPMPEFGQVTVTKKTASESKELWVSDASLLRLGQRYQLFRPDLRGNRLVEFLVTKVVGNRVHFDGARNWQIREFEPGQLVLPHLNFFEFHASSDLRFQGITFDGGAKTRNPELGGRPFVGHTTHSGLLFYQGYAIREDGSRPAPMRGLVVRDCRFRNLLGRGVVAYNMADVVIDDCDFEEIGAEAVEMDHLSTNCSLTGIAVRRAMVAIQLNDVTEVTVSDCRLDRCGTGIHVKRVLEDPELNRGLLIRGNRISRATRGIVVDAGAGELLIQANILRGIRDTAMLIAGSNSLIRGNLVAGARRLGIDDRGLGNQIEGNLILPALDAAKDFEAIRRAPADR